MLPTVEETRGYDFQDPENAEKWKGFFISSLRKVLESVHPTLTADEGALEFVESLCLRLLGMLCAPPAPMSVADGEERVARSFPTPLDRWALTEAREAAGARRRKLLLPLERLHLLLQKEVLLYKIDMSVTTFMTVILEFISTDILRLAGNFVKKISQKSGYQVITCSDIKTAMCADKVLIDMFYQDSELASIAALPAFNTSERGRRASLSYGDLVRDLLTDERTFLRDLNLMIRVFKEELEKIVDDNKVISLIFGNIVDIYELTVTLLGNLEDAMEMSQDSLTPYIGSCFEELAEVEEFRAFVRYANIVTRRESREALAALVDDPQLGERLETAGHGFRLAVKYCLPRLLLSPVAHVFVYHSYVLAMLPLAPASDDRESFKQVECNLHPIEKLLTRALGNGPQLEGAMRSASRARRKLAIDKCNELARLVDNWDAKDVPQCCNEFIREDTLSKLGPGKRVAERRAFLFDGLLLLCKPVTSLVTVNSGVTAGPPQLKLKEKLHIRKLDIVDRPDGEEGRNLIELCPRVGPPLVLAASSPAEKRYWMSDLVMLNTKPMLDRSLDSILLDLERRHPLRLPSPSLYRFAEPDGPHNILLEHAHGPAPLIKGATLLKLVERLTYHVHADLNLVRTFLTTYRSFCSPADLLALLIERFDIPEPHLVYDAPRPIPRIKIPKKDISPNASLLDLDLDIAECVEISASSDAEKLSKNTAREDWKRYRKEFQQPVKFRVINVLRHWVDQHFYDFEREPELLSKLKTFLESVDGKPMRKWVQSVLKTVQRKSGQQSDTESVCSASSGVSYVFDRLPPAPLRHVAEPEKHDWHPLALHPLEVARQLTLMEFQLYRQVKPSELVGAAWTKKDKEKSSPNLCRISKNTTSFTRWIEKWVVESENVEERAGVLSWFLELAVALSDLNNFNGVFAVVAACESASVYRLKYTFQMLPPRLLRALDQFRELSSDHFRLYQERLRSINPPCVPFMGVYLTKLLHIEEGNPDFLSNTELINFSKRRMVAEITGEIQQYQNQPYCLTLEPRTRAFLENLDPFPGMDDNEVTNYLYGKSKEIEPKGAVKQTPKFPRRYPELSLKPVKVSRRRHDTSSTTLASTTSLVSLDGSLSVSQLSPTSSAWDGASVASLPLHAHDQGNREERSVTSPRLERCSSSSLAQLGQLSLLDKLFDKSKSVATLHRNSGSTKDEPPSPRDNHSPKRRPALSPRGALVDADTHYNRRRTEQQLSLQERVPPLLPRGGTEPEAPPVLPRRPPSPHASTEPPPEPPDRPLPSPKHHDLFRSPALSPAPAPVPSPMMVDRAAFSFPSATSPGHIPSEAAPPPLPPRRRRDSAAPHTPHPTSCGECGSSPPAPPVPPVPPPAAGPPSSSLPPPPPLPPRPPPAPELLRPAHSALLQRRHTAALAPKLPPKPAAAAVAPRT